MSPRAAAALWASLFAAYARCVPGAPYFEDSPELLAAAAALGNSHEPGYPLLSCLGRLALLVPAGGPAFRMNLAVAACAAGAATALGWLAAALARERRPQAGAAAGSPAVAVYAAGVWGFSDAFWWEAVIGDKYAPYFLTFVLLVALAWRCGRAPAESRARAAALLALLTGVAFAHHQYSLFALPAVAWALARLRALGRARAARALALGAGLAALPLSTKVLYPPIRSAAGVEVDWGGPGAAPWLWRYLTAARYHGALAETTIYGRPDAWAARAGQALGFLREEFPPILLVAAPVGAAVLLREAPGFALAALACLLADAAYAVNYTEKIVRWYEPAYGLLALLSATGLAVLAGRAGRGARGLLAGLALAGVVTQGARGLDRNDLSRFYGAHDLGRQLLAALPSRAIYLGAGDQDLFPVWAAQLTEGSRPDVLAVGLGSFVDSFRADHGWQRRARRELRIASGSGRAVLGAILGGRFGRPVLIAAEGYSADVWNAAGTGIVYRARGIVGTIAPRWDTLDGFRETERLARAATFRGLAYARAGAVCDLDRVRDEVARDGLMHYARSYVVLAGQLAAGGLEREACALYRRCRRLMEPLAGPLPAGDTARLPPAGAMRRERAALALGFRRLGDRFAERGVDKLAALYRSISNML